MRVIVSESVVKPETVDIKLTVPKGSEAATLLPKLLYSLKYLGDIGASRSVVIDDVADFKTVKGFTNAIGFDGDGSDKILSLTVDGVDYEAKK